MYILSIRTKKSQCPYIADLMKLALGIGNCTLRVYNNIVWWSLKQIIALFCVPI